jgi:hypothetical protein
MVDVTRITHWRWLSGSALACAAAILAAPAAATDVIYINPCPGGCVVTPGVDDAINHVSSIPSSASALTAFSHGDAIFQATVGCIRKAWARFDVEVTTQSPGTLPRREIMLAGTPQQVGMPSGVPGVAPLFAEPRDNAIVFVFSEAIGADPDVLCWTASQEVAHLYALDHEFHCEDLMSYTTGCGIKSFTDFDAQCGEYSPRTCLSGAATQNSAALLSQVPGLGDRILLADFERGMPAP